VLLRYAVDSTAAPSRADLVEAWLLLGVVEFYRGNDSATASSFHQALALEPRLEASGLARYDSALVVLFEAERRAERGLALEDCTRRCPSGVALPRLVSLPELDWIPTDPFDLQHALPGRMILRFVVDTAGFVAPGSIVVVANTFTVKELETAYLRSLERARFMPAHGPNGRVPAVLQAQVRFQQGRRLPTLTFPSELTTR